MNADSNKKTRKYSNWKNKKNRKIGKIKKKRKMGAKTCIETKKQEKSQTD